MAKRGWMRASDAGSAPQRAIDSIVRAVGMIVVCVEAAVEVSTTSTSSLSNGLPSTRVPSALSTSPECALRNAGPATD